MVDPTILLILLPMAIHPHGVYGRNPPIWPAGTAQIALAAQICYPIPMSAKKRQQVIFTYQSHLNLRRWQLQLICSHTVWKTQKSRPTVQFVSCPECTAREMEQNHRRQYTG